MRKVLLLLLLTPAICMAQSANTASLRIGASPPNAASLGKFGDIPVSLNTGLPDISVPLFTVKGRTLELPITLRYHGGGIRVEEKGSWVGLGWALEAGGTITRTVRGVVDEFPNGYYNTGHVFRRQAWQTPTITLIGRIVGSEIEDGEPDQFFYSFGGRSGQFVMGATDSMGVNKVVRTIPYQPMRFEPSIGGSPYPAITKWVVKAEDGTRYTFAAVDTTTDLSTIGSGAFGGHYGQRHASSWHLTEIRSPGGDIISLYYSPYTVTHRMGRPYEESFHNVVAPNPSECVPSLFQINNVHEVRVQRLDSIKSAQHTVKFVVGGDLRYDALSPTGVRQEPRLDQIVITTSSGAVLRKFKLAHHNASGSRLRLDRVYEISSSNDSLPPYQFTYDSQSLPADNSASQDHWGFWNGKSNTSLLPAVFNGSTFIPGADRSPDATKVKAGSLKRITYPTGGYTDFDWEINDYGAIGSSLLQWGDGPEKTASVSAADFENDTHTFTIGGLATVTAEVTTQMDPFCDGFGCPRVSLDDMSYEPGFTHLVNLAPGQHTLEASSNMSGGFASIVVKWKEKVPVKKMPGSGLRIAAIRNSDAMGKVDTTLYIYTMADDTARSSGVLKQEPLYTHSYSTTACSYFSRSAMSRMPLGDGPVVTYREVTVLRGSSGNYGRTRVTFRTFYDEPDGSRDIDSWPGSRVTSNSWKRGQPLDTTVMNAARQTQRRVQMNHKFITDTMAIKFPGISAHAFSGGVYGSLYYYNRFDVVSGWTYVDSTTTYTYNESGGGSFTTGVKYTYGNPKHAQPTEIAEWGSDGTRRVTRMKYPHDYAAGSTGVEAQAITAMRADSVHNQSAVIERWVVEKTGSTERVLSAEVLTFKRFAAQQYLPYQRFVLSSPSPVTGFVPSSVSGSFTKDSRYVVQETVDSVDAYGRIQRVTDARGKITRYTYNGGTANALLTKIARARSASEPNALVTDIAYDGSQNVSSIRDEGGTFRYFTYDGFGRLRQVKNHSGTVVQAYGYTYGIPSFVSDTVYLSQSPVKRVVTNTYVDGLGRPIQTVVHDGTNYTVTALQYDGAGREWRRWKPFTRATADYDASFATNATSFYNTYLSVANAKPYTETLYQPDPLDRIRSVLPEYTGSTPPDTILTSYGTDAGARQAYIETRDALGKRTRSYRDAFGREVKSILGYGATGATTTVLGYNVLGQRTQVTDPRGLISRDSFDTRGLLRKRTTPDAGTVQRKYDRAGNLRFSQDANQAAAGKVFFTSYDFANRPVTSGVGTATFSSLDPDAAPTALETTNSNWVNVWAYDAKPANVVPWSHFWTQISPLTLSNVNGRRAAEATRSNGAWQVTLYSYDTDGRVVKRYTFTQNNAGSAVLTAVNTTDSSTYDLKGNRTFRVLTVGSNTWRQWYDYDGAGRLWKVFSSTGSSKPASPDVTYTYRPSGAIDSRTFLGGPSVPFRYTIREELARIGDPATTTYPFSARYSYHKNGTVNEAEFYSAGSPAAQKRYRYVMGTSAYDALNRLTSADFSPWSGSAWTSTTAHDLSNIGYDASGNLTSFRRYRETTSLIDNLTYTIPGSSNKLSSISEAAGSSSETWDAEAGSFTYDANGNILTTPAPYSITATTYDHRNQPISITRAGTTTTYRYNGGGWRIAKQVGSGNTEIYIQDGPVTLAVFTLNSSGTATSWYFNILAGDKVVGRHPNTGSKSYYHTDLLGSTRVVVQGATVTQSYDYDPYGMLMPGRTLAGATKEGFTGKERDSETGLDYFGQRLYMPAFGRWSTVDPVADSFPQWTPYNYVEGNPVTYTDPFGLCPIPPSNCVDVAFAVVGVKNFVQDPSWGSFGGALLDVAGAVPGVPSVAALRRADDVIDAARLAKARAEFGAVRRAFWKNEASANASAYSAENLARMRKGRAPIGEDGFPMELHHRTPLANGGTNEFDNLQIMTQTDHRRGDNYRRNHPDIPPED